MVTIWWSIHLMLTILTDIWWLIMIMDMKEYCQLLNQYILSRRSNSRISDSHPLQHTNTHTLTNGY